LIQYSSTASRGPKSLRILLVDDDTALSAMLTEYLSGEGFEVDAVAHSRDAAPAALSGRYAAVVLDIMLPGVSGLEVLREIRQTSRVPVIMLTAKGDDVDRVVGLEMGADDYISKPFYSRELLARLKAVLRRTTSDETGRAGRSLAIGELVLVPARRTATWKDVPLVLTATEYNLLELLVTAAGDLVKKDELSEKALGRRRESYDRSVDVHITHLRQKLTAATAGQIEINTVWGVGYTLAAKS
jgi:two-component system OmpR family response regulator